MSVAPFETVIVPPEDVLFAVYTSRSSVPAETERLLLIDSLLDNVAVPPDLLTVALLRVVENEPPIVWAPAPSNVTVAVPAVKALVDELLVQIPATFKLRLFALSVPPEMVRSFLTTRASVTSCATGEFVLFTVRFQIGAVESIRSVWLAGVDASPICSVPPVTLVVAARFQ